MSDPLTNTVVIQADSVETWDPVLKRYVDIKNSVAAGTYSREEVDARLAAKAEQATTYTKETVDNKLNTKAAQATTYTKDEVDEQLTTVQETLSDGLAGKQDALTFTPPLSLTESTLGVDFSSHTLMTGSLEVVQDGLFLEDLFCGRDCYITRTLATNTLSNLDSDGSNPPIAVTSNMELAGILDVGGGGITCSDPTSTSIVAQKNLTLGQTGDQYGGTYLHLRNRVSENGVIFESTNAVTPLMDLIARMGNGVQRNIRLEGRSEFSVLEAPCWQIGGAGPGGLGEFLVADTRCAVRDHMTIGTTSVFPTVWS